MTDTLMTLLMRSFEQLDDDSLIDAQRRWIKQLHVYGNVPQRGRIVGILTALVAVRLAAKEQR